LLSPQSSRKSVDKRCFLSGAETHVSPSDIDWGSDQPRGPPPFRKVCIMRPQVRATNTSHTDATALRSTVTHGPGNRNLPAPGPFSANTAGARDGALGGALMTGLLVMYPVAAIVVLVSLALPAIAG
jgi:hypothetical protein